MCPCHASSSKHNCSQPWHFHNRLEGETPQHGSDFLHLFKKKKKTPLCSEGPDFNIQIETQWGGDALTARQSVQRAGGVIRALCKIQKGFVTSHRVREGWHQRSEPTGKHVLNFLQPLSVVWCRFTGRGISHKVMFERAEMTDYDDFHLTLHAKNKNSCTLFNSFERK